MKSVDIGTLSNYAKERMSELLKRETAIERADPIYPTEIWRSLLLAQAEALEWAAIGMAHTEDKCRRCKLWAEAARLRKEAE